MSLLSDLEIKAAVEFNSRNSQLFGWRRILDPLCSAFGIVFGGTPANFAEGAAAYQAAHGLTVDGRVGNSTLSHLWKNVPQVKQAIIALGGSVSIPNADEYEETYATAGLTPGFLSKLDTAWSVISDANAMSMYRAVGVRQGMPWYMVALIHMRESTFNFKTYLHNGDPLKDRAGNPTPTVHVPAGKLFLTWDEAAQDALSAKARVGLSPLPGGVAAECYFFERFNGMGYRNRGKISPYLWSGTSAYVSGKFSSDGHYDPSAIDKQIGCMAMRKWLEINNHLFL